MGIGSFERRVPLEFAPAVSPDQRLVGFRVVIDEHPLRDGRLWRLRLKYAVLPRGIHERARSSGASPESLAQHPDAYWTTVDPGFLDQPSGYSVGFCDASGQRRNRPGKVRELQYRAYHRSCALFVPRQLGLDSRQLLDLLNDPLDYHWPELKSQLIGALATLATNDETHGRLKHFHRRRLLDFLACVFAAKWVLDTSGNSLQPVEAKFSFPRDTGWLWQVMVAFGLQDDFGLGEDFLPWPSGFDSDEYPGDEWLFQDILEARLASMRGVWKQVGSQLESEPPTSQQDYVDRVVRLTGGYPRPHTVHDIERLVELTDVEPAEAMSWVWADQWSPARLAKDFKDSLLPLRLRLESLLVDSARRLPPQVPDHMVLDTVPMLRSLVRRLLQVHFGENWLRDALPENEQMELARLFIKSRREGTDFDYAELPTLKELVRKHWERVFLPFLRHWAKYSTSRPPEKKQALQLLDALIPARNARAHRRRKLSPEENDAVRTSYVLLSDWLAALETYTPPEPAGP